MEFYAQVLGGSAQLSAFAAIVLSGGLLALGGVWSWRRLAALRALVRVG